MIIVPKGISLLAAIAKAAGKGIGKAVAGGGGGGSQSAPASSLPPLPLPIISALAFAARSRRPYRPVSQVDEESRRKIEAKAVQERFREEALKPEERPAGWRVCGGAGRCPA